MIIEMSTKQQKEKWKNDWHGLGLVIESACGIDTTPDCFSVLYYENTYLTAQFKCDSDFNEVEWSREDRENFFGQLHCKDFKA